MEEDSPDQPSAVCSTAQPMSDNTSGSLLSPNTSHECKYCSAAFELVGSLELHLASVHGEKLDMVLFGSSTTPDRRDVANYTVADKGIHKEVREMGKAKGSTSKKATKPDLAGDCSDSDWKPHGFSDGSDSDGESENRRKREAKRNKKIDEMVKNFQGREMHMVLPGSSLLLDSHSERKIAEEKVDDSETHVQTGRRERKTERKCDICNKVMTQNTTLKRHRLMHFRPPKKEKKQKYLCCVSNQPTSALPILHTTRACQHCSSSFVLVSSLELHLASVHGVKLDMALLGSSTPDTVYYDARGKRVRAFVCDVCNKAFNHACNLRRHRPTHFRPKRLEKTRQYLCEMCGKACWTPTKLEQHERTHTGVKPVACDVCDMRFKQTGQLCAHKRTHTGEKPFPCDVCGKQFSQSYERTKHRKTHFRVKQRKERTCVCSICRKTFARSDVLARHMMLHTGEKPNKCPHCECRFTQSGSLKSHIRAAHTGERPHVCDVCGKAFCMPDSLRKHKKIKHSGEKPSFLCSECGKGFFSSNKLKMHVRTHTGEKPYECPDCGKGFSKSDSLRQHLLIHAGEKPHACCLCSSTFRVRAHLYTHMKLVHKRKGVLQNSVVVPTETISS